MLSLSVPWEHLIASRAIGTPDSIQNADGRTDLLLGLYGGGVQVFYQVDPFMSVQNAITSIPAFSVYPNPAADVLHINLQSFNRKENYTLTVFNCMGQIMYQTKDVTEKMQLDVRNFSKGIYMLQLNSSGGTKNLKVLVDKKWIRRPSKLLRQALGSSQETRGISGKKNPVLNFKTG